MLSFAWCSCCFKAIQNPAQTRGKLGKPFKPHRQQSQQNDWEGLLKKDQSLLMPPSRALQKPYKALWIKLFQNYADRWASSSCAKHIAKRHGERSLWLAQLVPTLRTADIYSRKQPIKAFRKLGLGRASSINSRQRSKTCGCSYSFRIMHWVTRWL
jgi:hypothetical protein